MKAQFLMDGKEPAEAPYVYTISGLDNVILLNGFQIHETAYGNGVSIDHIDDLHRAIALHIITTKKSLSAKEFLFLRREMGMTQDEVASALGIDGQTVARYEKGTSPISGPADRMIRVTYLVSILPGEDLKSLLLEMRAAVSSDEISQQGTPTTFREEHGTWEEVHCS